MLESVYPYNATLNSGEDISLEQYRGKVLLIVNTASKCGFTPQYEGLQALQNTYTEQGFTILAFPCDQFGHQEPGSDQEIQQFCSLNYSVNFPLFKKIEVNGEQALPLYAFLKQQAPGILGSKNIKWNFTKFLVNKQGQVVKRYGPITKPEKIAEDIESLL